MNLKSNKTFTFLAASFLLLFIHASGQQKYELFGLRDLTNYWEINASLGANQFLGDLGGSVGKGEPMLKDYKFSANKMLAGLSGTYNINNYSAVNVGFNFAQISNADSLITNTGNLERWRWYRNLSFKSNVEEASATFTFYPVLFLHHKTVELLRFNPYIQSGLGVLHFNPKANLNGTWYELQPLHLEGQGFTEGQVLEKYPGLTPYKRTVIYIPVNVGVKYYFNNKWALSAGLFMRKTFTDYMDDISTAYIDPKWFYKYFPPDKAAIAEQLYSRSKTPWKVKPGIEKADSRDKDSYITFNLTLSIRLTKSFYIYYPRI